jgi:hypothetical protein
VLHEGAGTQREPRRHDDLGGANVERRERTQEPRPVRSTSDLDPDEGPAALLARGLDRCPLRVEPESPLDIGIDPGTIAGEFTATVVAAAAQMERRLVGQRTREALQAARERGIRLGRPRTMEAERCNP